MNQDPNTAPLPEDKVTSPVETNSIPQAEETAPENVSQATPAKKTSKPEIEIEKSPEAPDPVIIVERGIAHYIGFSFIVLFFIFFFFVPGISFTYLLTKLVDLTPPAVWVLAFVFSTILWTVFKLKIKGFMRSTYRYLAFSIFIFVILFIIYFFSSSSNIFSNILSTLGL